MAWDPSGRRLAVAIAALEAWARQADAAARRAEAAERDRLDDLDRGLDELVAAAQALAREVLEAAGYHQYKRGEWRRRRGGPAVATQELVRQGVVNVPGVRVLDRWVHDELVDMAAGPDPSPVEAMLARSAALAWAFVRWNEAQLAAMVHEPESTVRQLEDQDRRLDRAHRRHLAALRTLALVRKLALPTVQVNVTRQQVNVAGSVALPDGPTGKAPSPPPS